MKLKIFIYTIGVILAFGASSCKKWISVTPKTQIEESVFFKDRQGFIEALNGVYIKMVKTPLYGRTMTFGMVDQLGRIYVYPEVEAGKEFYDGKYLNATAYATITTTWNELYNTIANVNNIISHLETADKAMFRAGEQDTWKGEALGLRAFLHFDLVRLFTLSYRGGGGATTGIPYVTKYSANITPKLTTKDAIAKVIEDLKAAEQLLVNDTLLADFASRKERFNYYAVKATLARAYLWSLDEPRAMAEAEKVIAARGTKFPFVTPAAASATNEARDRVFSTEHLFGLTTIQLQTNYAGILDTTRTNGSSKLSDVYRAEIYENSNLDIRNQFLINVNLDPALGGIWYSKLYQPAFSNRMPLIKIPEMYYIVAECLASSDPARAVGFINTIRNARGLGNLNTGLSTSAVQNEIYKEYRKEMPLEGQLFYFYKRLDASNVGGFAGNYPKERYVLPLPQQEIDFGQ